MVEIVIVIVMLGMMAAWAVPKYGRTLNRARARNAMQNLSVIHAANMLYKMRTGGTNTDNCSNDSLCTNIGEINTLNGANSLNIVSSGVTYGCADGGTACTGTFGVVTVTVNLNNPVADGTNPTCADGGANICP